MATDLENLKTIRSNLIAALLADSADPQPTYSLDGESISRQEWRKGVQEQIKEYTELIITEEPFISETQAW